MRPALNSILNSCVDYGRVFILPHYEGGVLSSPKHLSAICADGMELTIVNSILVGLLGFEPRSA